MRKFSSEGSLLDLDFLPWKRVALKTAGHGKNRESGTYTSLAAEDQTDRSPTQPTPLIREPGAGPREAGGARLVKELVKEHSVSAENLSGPDKLDQNHLGVRVISETCRAYSDGQLAPVAQGSTESMELMDLHHTCSSSNPQNPQHRHHHKPRLTAAKVHLKSLFGQSPHSSNSNLSEHKDSAMERRSRLLFMRQWSQVGHGKKRKISQEELEGWAESLNTLLLSQTGVSVFGAFLRSEFSEENLQFYLACERYRHSSHSFSLQRRARDICATYIQPGAARERRIFSLLDTDCYPRFLQSDVYLSLLRDAD
ncbi:Regulator of G-protein signaling 1 [Liparis tanakae]|uniref:Regulator of G-protein signaling 1 n=1 Tax=Liparis tanakae TaxID=230148 RepID=A0A4Z2EVB6_9TELE|nr:Regulator of G-protein signaling 1 [Liparis tanakae]